MWRRVTHAVFAAFALLVGSHLAVPAWGGLVRGHGPALTGALVALAFYSAAALVAVASPDSDPAASGDDPLPRVLSYLAQ